MLRSALATLGLRGLFQAAALPAIGEQRVAFVIGNAQYQKL